MYRNNFESHRLPTISSYETALERWEKTKPVRGRAPGAERPLRDGRRRVDITQIIKYPNDDIGLRYYRTDVVTYHPDNSVTIEAYSSKTTNEFANKLLPAGVYAEFRGVLDKKPDMLLVEDDRPNNGRHWSVGLDGRYHRAPWRCYKITTMTVAKQGDVWRPVEGTKLDTFDWPRLNRKRANAALKKHNFAGFDAWLAAFLRFEPEWVQLANAYTLRNEKSRLMEALNRGPCEDGWMALGRTWGAQAPNLVKQAIYAYEGCVDVEEHEYLMADQIDAYMSARRKWGWMV